MAHKSFSASDIRERNHRMVFHIARRQGELLRPEISRETGMTPPTVMKVVQSFVERGILVEAGEAETTLGRRPMRLVFNPGAALAVGILFEGGEMHAGVVDLSGNVIRSSRIPMEHAFTMDTLPVIVRSIGELTKGIDAPLLGIGLGVPGVVDAGKHIIELAPLIGIVRPMDCRAICQEIRNRTGLTLCMDNDVNAAALGEYYTRRLPGEEDLLYISVGTGIGAGIVLNGKLRRGSRNLAGELGYAVHNASFRVDRARPGWLESQIGADALQRRFQWAGYGHGDGVPSGLVDFIVGHLSPMVANLATQLDIKLVVVGGRAVDCLGDALMAPLAARIAGLSLEPGQVERSQSPAPGVAGAAIQIIDAMLDGWLAERDE